MSAIENLIAEFSRLPGIGKKTATRLTFFLLNQDRASVERLASALGAVSDRVTRCARCGNFTEAELCDICADPRRDGSLVCVVEEASDIDAIERTGEFRGVYHVLGGHISPLDGIGPDDLRIPELIARIENGSGVREVIIATNPSMEGEVTATYVRKLLSDKGPLVTRIALGLPVGGDLEYADGVTIAQALASRREMN